ncbi:hypothetical protein ACROYT_G006466 [Oculina patagonica]
MQTTGEDFISLKAMNETNNSSASSIGAEVSDVTKIIVIGAYAIIFLVSFAGNLLIIHIVRTRPSIRQNPFSWLLVNTAVADLLDVITASAFTVPIFLCGDCWISGITGKILCKLIPFFLTVAICVSIWTLTIIAADRYLAIVGTVRQNKRPLSPRSVARYIIAVWLIASLIFSWELYKYRVDDEDGEVAVCFPHWHDDEELSVALYQAEMIVKVAITYAAPLVIMGVLYSLIAKFLWNHKPPGNANQLSLAHAKRTRSFRGVIKMLMTAVAVFAIFWLPVHVCHIMSVFYVDRYDSIPFVITGLLYWLAHANAAIHPWLFIAFSEHWRKETKVILQKICKTHRGVFDQLRLRTFSLPTLVTTPDMSSGRANTTKRGSYVATMPP